MTEEPTTPAPDSPAYQIFQIYADQATFSQIKQAMEYAGESNPETFIAHCVMQHMALIFDAFEGTDDKSILKVESEYLHAAMAYGKSQRQKDRMDSHRPLLKALQGGKA